MLRAKRQLEAAIVLERERLFEQAAGMYWVSLRTELFASLEQRGIQYASTSDALVLAMSDERMIGVQSELLFVHLVGTMAEWDEFFYITPEQLQRLKAECDAVRQRLAF